MKKIMIAIIAIACAMPVQAITLNDYSFGGKGDNSIGNNPPIDCDPSQLQSEFSLGGKGDNSIDCTLGEPTTGFIGGR